MSRTFSLRAGTAACAIAALALAGCTDQPTAPTSTHPGPDAQALAICGAACVGGGGGVILPPPPPSFTITSLSLADNTIPIGGASGSYTVTVNNSGNEAAPNAILQGYIVQGAARRAAGGLLANCGAGTGILPPGNCTMSFVVNASNAASGTGTLIPGIATFELDLKVNGSTSTKTIGLNLIPGEFTASGSTSLDLHGALGTVSASIANAGSQTYAGYSYQMTVIQGSAQRSAGSTPLACNYAGWGNLPPGQCNQTLYPSLTSTSPGSGTLVAGPATFVIQLLRGGAVLSSKQWPITLIDLHLTLPLEARLP
jgi:hypothetical protein